MFNGKFSRSIANRKHLYILCSDSYVSEQKVLKAKGIDQMIEEARESTAGETDAEHLRR